MEVCALRQNIPGVSSTPHNMAASTDKINDGGVGEEWSQNKIDAALVLIISH